MAAQNLIKHVLMFCVSELKLCKYIFKNISLFSWESEENRNHQKLVLNTQIVQPINKSAVAE